MMVALDLVEEPQSPLRREAGAGSPGRRRDQTRALGRLVVGFAKPFRDAGDRPPLEEYGIGMSTSKRWRSRLAAWWRARSGRQGRRVVVAAHAGDGEQFLPRRMPPRPLVGVRGRPSRAGRRARAAAGLAVDLAVASAEIRREM